MIIIPRFYPLVAPDGHTQNNMKIEFHGYEISIAVEGSRGSLMDKSEIRVYWGPTDVTAEFADHGDYPLFTDGDDLFMIMSKIEKRRV